MAHESTHRWVFILKAQCREFLTQWCSNVPLGHFPCQSLLHLAGSCQHVQTQLESLLVTSNVFFPLNPIDEFRLLLTAANSSFVCRLTTCKVHSGYSANSQIIPHFNKMTASLSKKTSTRNKRVKWGLNALADGLEGEICSFSCLFVFRLRLVGLEEASTYHRDGLWSEPITQVKQRCHFLQIFPNVGTHG